LARLINAASACCRGYGDRMLERPLPWDNWDLFADALGRGGDSPRRHAADRAVTVLRDVLGEGWLQDGDLPAEVVHANTHTLAFVRLLELALRLEQFADVSGVARLRKTLRENRTPESWYHVQLQLEIAELLAATGATIEVERGPTGGWPADVVATMGEAPVPIEAFAIFTSLAWREAVGTSDAISSRLVQTQAVHNVTVVAAFHGSDPNRDELEAWLGEVDMTAAAVASDGTARTVKSPVADARIHHTGDEVPSSFNGPDIAGSPFARILDRLNDKHQQVASGPDGVWLRVDLLDGVWQFSPWAYSPLPEKLAAMDDQLRQQFVDAAGLAGFVVSTGAASAYGSVEEESVQIASGSVGLRRKLYPLRGRETLIIPMPAATAEQANLLTVSYANEPASLDRSLKRVGVGTANEVFPRSPD
jgi:hypothetical protein